LKTLWTPQRIASATANTPHELVNAALAKRGSLYRLGETLPQSVSGKSGAPIIIWLKDSSMPSPDPTAATQNALRRFRRNRRGSAAVEFALVAPIFFALLFATLETAFIFFAGQVLEAGVESTGRLIYTSQLGTMTAADFKQDLCDRVKTLFNCDKLDIDLRKYAPGTPITITDPIDASGNYAPDFVFQKPATSDAAVFRAFYQWPLVVTGLGYNIANIGRGTSSSKKLLAATIATGPQ
jgi:Flp pilus assembly protein TadG